MSAAAAGAWQQLGFKNAKAIDIFTMDNLKAQQHYEQDMDDEDDDLDESGDDASGTTGSPPLPPPENANLTRDVFCAGGESSASATATAAAIAAAAAAAGMVRLARCPLDRPILTVTSPTTTTIRM